MIDEGRMDGWMIVLVVIVIVMMMVVMGDEGSVGGVAGGR